MVLIRFALLLLVLVVVGFFIAAHGVRAIVSLVVVTLILILPRTRGWQIIERPLVRLTGSRRRAAVLVTLAVIVVALAVNLVPLFR